MGKDFEGGKYLQLVQFEEEEEEEEEEEVVEGVEGAGLKINESATEHTAEAIGPTVSSSKLSLITTCALKVEYKSSSTLMITESTPRELCK